MNYIERIIDELWFEMRMADPEFPASLLPFYAQLVLTTGTATSLEDVHNAWAVWTNMDRPDHKSLILFDSLTPEVQEYDRLYMNVIRKVAAEAYS